MDAQDGQHILKAGDTMTGELAMGGNLVSGLPTTYPPLYSGDEATSWDQAMGLVSDAANVLVKKAGDAMPGPLAMSANKITAVADPTDPQDTATKNYVDIRGYATVGYTDSRDSKRVHKEGDTMTGASGLVSQQDHHCG